VCSKTSDGKQFAAFKYSRFLENSEQYLDDLNENNVANSLKCFNYICNSGKVTLAFTRNLNFDGVGNSKMGVARMFRSNMIDLKSPEEEYIFSTKGVHACSMDKKQEKAYLVGTEGVYIQNFNSFKDTPTTPAYNWTKSNSSIAVRAFSTTGYKDNQIYFTLEDIQNRMLDGPHSASDTYSDWILRSFGNSSDFGRIHTDLSNSNIYIVGNKIRRCYSSTPMENCDEFLPFELTMNPGDILASDIHMEKQYMVAMMRLNTSHVKAIKIDLKTWRIIEEFSGLSGDTHSLSLLNQENEWWYTYHPDLVTNIIFSF
jgi:hypothetical protein